MKHERQKALIIDGTSRKTDAWAALRGALKDVFSELGGGESYLRSERKHFYTARNVGKRLGDCGERRVRVTLRRSSTLD